MIASATMPSAGSRAIVRPELVRRLAASGVSHLEIAKRLRLGYDAIAMLVPDASPVSAAAPIVRRTRAD